MNWKEILKVSVVVAVTVVVIQFLLGLLGPVEGLHLVWDIVTFVGGLLATGLILNRRLKKEDWSILVGIFATIVITVVIDLILDILSL